VVPGGRYLRGTVLGPQGEPVADAMVRVAGETTLGLAQAPGPRTRTSRDGTFIFEDLGPGPFSVWATRDGLAGAPLTGIAGGTSGLRLRLEPEGRLSGIALAPDGSPLHEFTLLVLPAPVPGETEASRRTRLRGRPVTATMVRDLGGAFSLGGIRAGSYELRASARDGSGGTLLVNVKPAEHKEALRVVTQSGVTLIGRVVETETGAPLPDLLVQAISPAEHLRQALTDAQGSFALEVIWPGEVIRIVVTVDPTRHLPADLSIEVTGGRARIDVG
jgi:hypothetical protein